MKKTILAAALTFTAATSWAGGLLTNTNQSATFNRNPARDAAIGIDGVYSNPAGVAFMNQGWHLSLNWQNVKQTREILSSFKPFATGLNNGNTADKNFKGEAYAPVVPSFQVAYNTGKWSFQSAFAITGGGGKCEFEHGLGSFEAAASMLPALGQKLGINGYSIDSYMRGRQYYYGFQLGAAYKANDNLSLYVGGRLVYATTNYYGYIKDITISTAAGNVLASPYFEGVFEQALEASGKYSAAAEQYAAAGMVQEAAAAAQMAKEYAATAKQMGTLAEATRDVTLNCDQTGVGFTPMFGIDWRINSHWNIAAKYEMKTKMALKNKASSSASADNLAALDQFKDGTKVKEDIPAILTVGVEYSPVKSVRLNGGYHYYFDKQAKKYGDAQDKLSRGSYEILAGAEYDVNEKLTVSAGYQNTSYGLTDNYMKDMSFNLSSNSVGVGFKYRFNNKWSIDAGYFQTFYKKYEKVSNDYNNVSSLAKLVLGEDKVNEILNATSTPETAANSAFAGKDTFKRSNRILSVGVSLDF